MAALEIVEHDALDATKGNEDNGKDREQKTVAEPAGNKMQEIDKGKVQRLAVLRKQKGITEEQHKAFLAKAGVETSKRFTEAQYKKYAEWLEKQPDKEEESA